MRNKLFAVPAALLIAASLAACGGSGDSSQSVDVACKIAQDEMTAFGEKYADVASELGSDADAAKSALEDMKSEMASVGDKITNSEVSAAWGDFANAFNDMADAASEGDLSGTSDAMTSLSDAGTALGKLCPGN